MSFDFCFLRELFDFLPHFSSAKLMLDAKIADPWRCFGNAAMLIPPDPGRGGGGGGETLSFSTLAGLFFDRLVFDSFLPLPFALPFPGVDGDGTP